MQNLYTVTVPTFVTMLTALKGVMAKAAEHSAGNENDLLNDKLAPDMFPFVKQIQIATDHAKGSSARLAGVENPKMEDTETTVAQLQTRIDNTIAFLNTLTPAQFADAETRKIEMRFIPGKFLGGADYALQYAIPNFFFHVTTAYAIARKRGAVLGKGDFIGNLSLQDLN